MKKVTITNTRMLAGVASMLEAFGHDTEDHIIALGMDAPYLFLRNDGDFVAGTSLFRPQWINLYLHTIGFHLSQTTLSKEDVQDFLRQQRTALLPVHLSNGDSALQPMVFTGLARGRFILHSLHLEQSEQMAFTATQLLTHLPDRVSLYLLEAIEPQPTNFLPYLGESLRNLSMFWVDFQQMLNMTVTRQEYQALQKSHLRALMHDFLPVALLKHDEMLTSELKIANYFYEGVFQPHSAAQVLLRNKFPSVFVKNCVHWLKEEITDRLYELGATDEIVESYLYPTKDQY